jgi:hypothetical protein
VSSRCGGEGVRVEALLAVSFALVSAQARARAGDFFENATSVKPVATPRSPRDCNDSPSCGCEEEGRKRRRDGRRNTAWEGWATERGEPEPRARSVEALHGAFEHEVVDLRLPASFPSASSGATSRSDYDSPLGYGWSFNMTPQLCRFPRITWWCAPAVSAADLTGGGVADAPGPPDARRGDARNSFSATAAVSARSSARAAAREARGSAGQPARVQYLPEKALQGTSKFSPT